LAEKDNTEKILDKAKLLSNKYKEDKISKVTKITDYIEYEKSYYEQTELENYIP